MEMDKMGVVTTFIHNIVVYNIPLLYGTAGEIMVEKSGSLNLGVEGIMAVGAIFGYIVGCYANSLGVGILMAFLMGALCGLLFAALTVSLQANQNITRPDPDDLRPGCVFLCGQRRQDHQLAGHERLRQHQRRLCQPAHSRPVPDPGAG